MQEQLHKLDVRREEVRGAGGAEVEGRSQQCCQRAQLAGSRAGPLQAGGRGSCGAHRGAARPQLAQTERERVCGRPCAPVLCTQVLLTLYANIVERWSAADESEVASDAAALDADAAFSGSLLSLEERGLGGEDGAVAGILAAAAEHAGAPGSRPALCPSAASLLLGWRDAWRARPVLQCPLPAGVLLRSAR